MFEQLSGTTVIRAAAATGVSATDTEFSIFDRRSGTTYIVVQTAGRTAGTVTISLVGSFDGGANYTATFDTTGSISADGVYYLNPSAPIPADLAVHIVPAGGYDGTVGAILRSAGIVAGD